MAWLKTRKSRIHSRSRPINRVVYEVRFKPSDYLFPSIPELDGCVFEFALALLVLPSGIKLTPDPRIAPTAVGTINQFMTDPNRVITYICNSSDRRELAPKPKFDQWFDTFATDTFQKQDGTLTDADGLCFYIAALWQRNHPISHQIAVAFDDFAHQYNADKPA